MSLSSKEERIRRKQVMMAAGIKVPNTNSSWGPWWDKQWQKAITHKKTNDYYGNPSLWNIIRRTFNEITGNDTYQAEPLPVGGTLSQTDNSLGAKLDRAVSKWQKEGDPVRDLVLMTMPGASSKVSKPIANTIKETLPRLSARAWVPTSKVASSGVHLGPKTAAAIDATLVGGATGTSINDMKKNGPTVGNVLGTTLGAASLAIEAAPTIVEGYNAGKKAYITYQLVKDMNKSINASKITPASAPKLASMSQFEKNTLNYEHPDFTIYSDMEPTPKMLKTENLFNSLVEKFYQRTLKPRFKKFGHNKPLTESVFTENNKPVKLALPIEQPDVIPKSNRYTDFYLQEQGAAGQHIEGVGDNILLSSSKGISGASKGIHEAASHGTDYQLTDKLFDKYGDQVVNLFDRAKSIRNISKYDLELDYTKRPFTIQHIPIEYRATKNEILFRLGNRSIDDVSDLELIDMLEKVNGYGESYVRSLKKLYKTFSNSKPSKKVNTEFGEILTSEKSDPFITNLRQDIKYAPIVIGAGVGAASTQKYKNGGMIRRFQNSGKVEPSFWDRIDNWVDAAEIPMAVEAAGIGKMPASKKARYIRSHPSEFSPEESKVIAKMLVPLYGVMSPIARRSHEYDERVAPQDNTRVGSPRVYMTREAQRRIHKKGKGGTAPDPTKGRFTFKKSQMVKNAEQLNGKKDMRKKLIKSDVVTNKKKRVRKGQEGLKFVTYTPVDIPIHKPEELENPFSEYNFPSTYREYTQTEPVQIEQTQTDQQNETPKQPQKTQTARIANYIYNDRSKWVKDLKDAYKKAGITNENALKMLIAQDALESGWGKSAQGKFNYGNLTPGKSWKGEIVNGRDHDSKGRSISQKFRSYGSMEEYAADKVQFLKTLYDFDENDDISTFTHKLQGGNKGKRKYAAGPNYIQLVTKIYNTSKL